MPKKLSDITHQYERSAADLEQAQDSMTETTERARAKVDAAAHAHRAIADELRAYLREHHDEVVVSNDHGYHFDPSQPGSIRRRPVFWSHHVWIEDRPDVQPATYRVPNGRPSDGQAAMATAWGDVEPNGEPVTVNPDD